MNVEGLVGPGLERLNGCTELGDIVRKTGTYKVEHLGDATRGKPCGACSAMGVAVVEGRAVCPDMQPFSRHMAQASKGDRGRGCVLLEKSFISKVIAEPVRSGKKGLRGVEDASAAKGIRHGRPYTDA